MATRLAVHGPFDIDPSKSTRHVSAKHGKDFWAARGAILAPKQGIYVFAMRAGKGFTPWYVGQAKKGFKQETFTPHKLGKYNQALSLAGKGTPVLFLVAPQGSQRKVPVTEINHMEKELIQDALLENPRLTNVQHTKNVPRWSIRGVVRSGPGKPPANAREFRIMMGL